MSKETEQILLFLDKYIDARKDSNKEPGTIYVTKVQFHALQKEHQKAHQHGDWVRIEQPVLVEDRDGAGGEVNARCRQRWPQEVEIPSTRNASSIRYKPSH